MANAYNAPLTEQPSNESVSQKKLRFWNRFVRFSIYGIILPLLFGVSGTVIAMSGAFNQLSEAGAADPVDLSGAIVTSMRTTQIGLGIAVIATVCLVIGLKKRRALRDKL